MRSFLMLLFGTTLLVTAELQLAVPSQAPSSLHTEAVNATHVQASLTISERNDGVASGLRCVIENRGVSPVVVPSYVRLSSLRFFDVHGKAVQVVEVAEGDIQADFRATELTVLKPGQRLVLRNRPDEIKAAWDSKRKELHLGLHKLLFPQKLYAAVLVWEIRRESLILDGNLLFAKERFPDANCNVRLTSNPVVYRID